jgi:ABC-type nitrate/sulfonate/bicarbonate transport system substrate-binding protein
MIGPAQHRLESLRSGRSERENNLIDSLLARGISRRDFIRSAVVLGMGVPTIAAVLEACQSSSSTGSGTSSQVPQVNVSYANLPYWDTCTAVIGVAQGWYQEVGITLSPPPQGSVIAADDAIAVYASGRDDVMQFPGAGFLPAIKTIPPFAMFAVTSIFFGYAVIAQPNAGYKSYQEFVQEGVPKDQAMREAVGQIKGKRYAYPVDANVRQFLALVLQRGGLTTNDLVSLVNQDNVNVALMQAGRADFQSGGGPSRLTLQKAGFKVILTSGDLGASATASVDSPELSALIYNGLTASQQWFNSNHDTALRLASVNFRINQQMNDHPELTVPIHVPFLNSKGGTNFNADDAAVAYSTIDPFLTFDKQKAIYDDDTNPLNIKYVVGAAIKSYEKQGVIKPGQYKLSDITTADSVYHELVGLKAQTEQSMKDATAAIANASGDTKIKAEQTLAQATLYYNAFDYLDSSRTAKAAVTAAKG